MRRLLLTICLTLPAFASGPCSNSGTTAFLGAALPVAYDCTPKVHRDRTMTALEISLVTLHAMDIAETKYAIREGYARERNPVLRPLLAHEPAGIAFLSGASALQSSSANYLVAHGRRKTAMVTTLMHIGLEVWVVGHNYRVITEARKGAR